MERFTDSDLLNPRSGDSQRPATWSDDPNCAACARVVSAEEILAQGLERCPFCGGELVWPVEEPGAGHEPGR